MTDPDRDGVTRREENVTIVQTGERRGGGSTALVAIVVIVALVVLLYFVFGRGLNRAADEVGVNVNIDAPKVQLPDVKVEVPDVKVPKVDVDSSASSEGNKSR
jgi:preprotein translocase subunit SecF